MPGKRDDINARFQLFHCVAPSDRTLWHQSSRAKYLFNRHTGVSSKVRRRHHMPSAPATLPLPLQDNSRASRTIYSLLASEEGEPYKACLFYSVIGAEILKKYYGIDAKPVAGAALYRVSTERPDLLAFAVPGDGFTSNKQAFHSWVMAGSWSLDFMSPFFPEMIAATGQLNPCPRRAFQKRSTTGKASLIELRVAGDFIHVPDPALTNELLSDFHARMAYVDLANIARDWFMRPPHAMAESITVANAQGQAKSVALLELEISGFW